MKKIVCIFLAIILIMVAAGCSTTATDETTPSTESDTTESDTTTASDTSDTTTASDTVVADDFDPGEYTIVFSTILTNHPVLRCCELGFAEACEELGYNYQIVGPEAYDINEMNAAAEAAAASGADAVLIWANDASCFTTIKTMKNDYSCLTGVPHCRWDQSEIAELDFCMACEPVTYAEAVADYFSEELEGKTGSVAITQASYNENEDAAAAAFTARIEEYQADGKLQGITVLDPAVEGATDITESTNVNASIIQANDDLIAAFSLTGNGPVTWSNAARKCGLEAGDILIVAMDYTADNLAEIEAGYCSAIVAQPLYEECYQAVYNFDAMLRGGTVDFWTELDAPLAYNGGEGVNDPAYYTDILDRVSDMFG